MITVNLYHPINGEDNEIIYFSGRFSVSGGNATHARLYLNGILSSADNFPAVTGLNYIYPINDLLYSTTYSWYVTVYEPGQGWVQSQETWSFTTTVAPPSKAINPTPANNAEGVAWETTETFGKHLSWENGGGATKYDVYFGTVGNLKLIEADVDASVVTYATVRYTTTVDKEGVTHAFVREHDAYSDTEIDWNVPFYWRIISKNANTQTTGDIWAFDARPAKVTNNTPVTGATGISPKHTSLDVFTDHLLGWDNGSYDGGKGTTDYTTEYFDLYTNFGLQGGTPYLFDTLDGENTYEVFFNINWPIDDKTPGSELTVNSLKSVKPYLWRVDARNEFGTTTGDLLTFTTGINPLGRVNRPPNELADDADNGIFTVVGGGRHTQNLVVVAHKKIYYKSG